MTRIRKEKTKDLYLFSTSVENFFINEYLPVAPGEYVKVYLFCLMYAEHGQPVENSVMAKVLGLTETDIENAWDYWEDRGAIKRAVNREGEIEIVFKSHIEEIYGDKKEEAQEDEAVNCVDLEIKSLYDEYTLATGRPISSNEMDRISDGIEVYNITPDVFSYAIKYCKEREKYSIEYIMKVALSWTEDGCRNIAEVRDLLDKKSMRNNFYYSVFRELGMKRAVTPGDREIMNRWLDEMKFEPGYIISVCRRMAGKKDLSLNYINAILVSEYSDGKKPGDAISKKPENAKTVGKKKTVRKDVLRAYYAYLQEKSENDQKNHIKEVSDKITEMQKKINLLLLSFDFSEGAKEKRDKNKKRKEEIRKRKEEILVENGYEKNYLSRKYKCSICKDTGITDDGKYCSCVKERAGEAYIWNQSRIK